MEGREKRASICIKKIQALAGVAQRIEHGSAEPKGHQFDSQLGHMPGLWARSPVGGV